ncbi:MAG: hypothetical protein ACK6D3_03160 [Planctomycetaceae bacterium]
MDSQKADVETPVVRRTLLGRGWWAFALVVGGAWWAWERPASQEAAPSAVRTPQLLEWVDSGPAAGPANDAGVVDPPSVTDAPVDAFPGSAPEATSPEQQVLGVWRDFYRGERTLTLKADGTGTMVVKLAGMAKKLFAETLQFDLTWGFEEGLLVMSTVDGRPASKFEVIRKLYGDRAEYEVLELTSDQMRLKDAGGKTEYDWRRPEKLYEDLALDEQDSL